MLVHPFAHLLARSLSHLSMSSRAATAPLSSEEDLGFQPVTREQAIYNASQQSAHLQPEWAISENRTPFQHIRFATVKREYLASLVINITNGECCTSGESSLLHDQCERLVEVITPKP